MTVFAISTAKNNAELIAECAELGYLRKEWYTLDPTYGLGRFWKVWQPDRLRRHDIDPEKAPDGPLDFTKLTSRYERSTFDAVVFDPPYKLNGTGGSHASDEAYGVANSDTWQSRMGLCARGIVECRTVLKPGGMLLVKCQDQVCSGQVRWQTIVFTLIAEGDLPHMRLLDMLHLPSYRPQPSGRRQVHARRNYSTLLVLEKLKT